jgi:hypothetical protein
MGRGDAPPATPTVDEEEHEAVEEDARPPEPDGPNPERTTGRPD